MFAYAACVLLFSVLAVNSDQFQFMELHTLTLAANSSALLLLHMWQSRVEIEHYFVVYFDHVTTFKVL